MAIKLISYGEIEKIKIYTSSLSKLIKYNPNWIDLVWYKIKHFFLSNPFWFATWACDNSNLGNRIFTEVCEIHILHFLTNLAFKVPLIGSQNDGAWITLINLESIFLSIDNSFELHGGLFRRTWWFTRIRSNLGKIRLNSYPSVFQSYLIFLTGKLFSFAEPALLQSV